MDLTPVKTPQLVKSVFPSYVWDMPNSEKAVYLTFDDGPTPKVTSWVLEQLKSYKAKATFFCIGSNIEKHPEVFQQIINEGHVIGNHTHNHLKGWKVKTKAYLEDIEYAEEALNCTNEHLKLFRPPYGKLTPKQGKKLQKKGYNVIMWDVLSFDWDASVSKEDCLSNVISKAKEGSIIVFHDSLKAKERLYYTLPKVLEYFAKKGFEFKPISFK